VSENIDEVCGLIMSDFLDLVLVMKITDFPFSSRKLFSLRKPQICAVVDPLATNVEQIQTVEIFCCMSVLIYQLVVSLEKGNNFEALLK
jgi:hypothetical protein